MTEPRLETRSLSRNFGALRAVRDIDFKLEAGARHALIGPNGAGKTTFINLLTGVLPPTRGRVLLKGRDITAKAQAERVKLGIARTFQINRLFRGLSVLENVYIAVAERVGAASSMLYPAGRRRDVIDESMRAAGDAASSPTSPRHRISELPYGRQRLVELAIALGLKPEVLLLDEPAAGVPSAESHIILDAIDALPKDIGVLIIDHDMDLVFRFAKHITVLVRGAMFAEGTPKEIGANPTCARSISGRPQTKSPVVASALELKACLGRLRRDRGAGGHQSRARAGRKHQRDRPQRRRQDHAAGDHHGPHHAAQARSCWTGRTSTACRSIAARSRASASCRRSARFFPR